MTRSVTPDPIPAAGLRLFILGEEGVLFSPAAQEIYGLNTAATLAWCLLEEGRTVAEIATRLTEIDAFPAEDAKRRTAELFAQWQGLGWLAGPAPPTPAPPAFSEAPVTESASPHTLPPYEPQSVIAEGQYRLVDRVFCLRYATAAQLDWVGPVIRHLEIGGGDAAHEAVDLVDADGTTLIYSDRQPKWSVPALAALAPHVKALFWLSVIQNNPLFLVFHAGVVGRGGRCLMLPAAPGSGKSSLAAALARQGFSFFSDEVALCAEDRFALRPVPLGICVKSSGWALLMPLYPELAEARTHDRVDGKIVRYLPPPPGPKDDTYHPVGAIVFPRYAPDLETALVPLAKAEALRRLLAECLAVRKTLDEANVGRLVEWIKAVPCYELPNSSLAEATKRLRDLTALWG
jgi:hypothetical protein